jgi:hypothetical protein
MRHLPQDTGLSDPSFSVHENANLIASLPEVGDQTVTPINVTWINDDARIGFHDRLSSLIQ